MRGGRIWLDSESGKGSTFYFTVCFKYQPRPVKVPIPEQAAMLKGVSVLVVDDNATNRHILEKTLLHWEIRIIIREIQRLEEILSGLIDFTHHEGVQLEEINPHELIRYVIDIHGPRLEEKHLRVETDFAKDVEEIPTDPERFQQIVRNLLANAIEASPFGELIRIETGTSMLHERVHKIGELNSEAYFEMRIHNRGQPIPAADI